MAALSSILPWRIPWIEEPGRLQSTGSQSQTRLKQLGIYLFIGRKSLVFFRFSGLNSWTFKKP